MAQRTDSEEDDIECASENEYGSESAACESESEASEYEDSDSMTTYDCGRDIEANSDMWYGLVTNLLDTRCDEMDTITMFKPLIKCITDYKDMDEDERADTLENVKTYSELAWLPPDFSGLNNRRTCRMIDAWRKEFPLFEKIAWKRYNDYYERVNKNERSLYIDVIFDKAWFSQVDMDIKRKIYFWRQQFRNKSKGIIKGQEYAKHIIRRCNLCWMAYIKIYDCMPDDIDPQIIPLIVWNDRDPKGSLYKRAKWIYPTFDKKKQSQMNKQQPIITTTYSNQGKRRSNRLRSKNDKIDTNITHTPSNSLNNDNNESEIAK